MSYQAFNGLWITEHRKNGKMVGKDSIMISHPPFCLDRCVGVCNSCYSKRLSGYRPNLWAKQKNNTDILLSDRFVPCKINTIDSTLRWSSTGEIINVQMLTNISKMAELNNHITHQIWTKKAGIILNAEYPIPENLRLVWSATKIDYPKPFIPKRFDMAFYVYSSRDKIPDGVHICLKHCSDCGFCYKNKSVGVIAEVMK
jgi:hypothetical protein